MKLAVAVYTNLLPAEDAIADLETLGVQRHGINVLASVGTDYQAYLDHHPRLRYVEGHHDDGDGAGSIGPLIATGPLLAGVIAGGAATTRSDIEAVLVDAGVPQRDAPLYLAHLDRGRTVVLVLVEEELLERAVAILQHYGTVPFPTAAAPTDAG